MRSSVQVLRKVSRRQNRSHLPLWRISHGGAGAGGLGKQSDACALEYRRHDLDGFRYAAGALPASARVFGFAEHERRGRIRTHLRGVVAERERADGDSEDVLVGEIRDVRGSVWDSVDGELRAGGGGRSE